MVNVGDKIFVGCGSNASSSGLSDWWEYDITNNTWLQKTGIPANGRHHPYFFGIGNYAYVGFGHGSVSGPEVIQTHHYLFIMIFIDMTRLTIVGK